MKKMGVMIRLVLTAGLIWWAAVSRTGLTVALALILARLELDEIRWYRAGKGKLP